MKLIIQNNQMQLVEGVSAQFPYVLNLADSRDLYVPWHWHEELEFSYVKEGSLRVCIPGHSYTFHPGEGFYINANVMHMMEPADPKTPVVWDSHMFHASFLGSNYRNIFEIKYLDPVLKNKNVTLVAYRGETENQQNMLELMRVAASQQQEDAREFLLRNTFSSLWLLLMQEIAEQGRQTNIVKTIDQERIQTMLLYIHQHYARKLSLEQIASSAALSTRECLRCFKTMIGKSPFEYLMDYRIQVAEDHLNNISMPITEIAAKTGFCSTAYFSKCYKSVRGITPSQYRRNVKHR